MTYLTSKQVGILLQSIQLVKIMERCVTALCNNVNDPVPESASFFLTNIF